MKPIYKKDTKCNGYIAYYKKHKGIVGQGLTKEEALHNLNKDVKSIKQ